MALHRMLALTGVALAVTFSIVAAPATVNAAGPQDASDSGPFVTILFSRSEITAADNCVPDDVGVARLDTMVAPYLASLGMSATGSLETGRTSDATETCTHWRGSLTASWADASALSTLYGWSFVSHTATYPANIDHLSAQRSYNETCGSADAIDAHGLHGGHGLIAYPGVQAFPINLQNSYGSQCFAWARKYGGMATTAYTAGTTAPYIQNTGAPNGGPCNDQTASCYTVTARGSARYVLPDGPISRVQRLTPGHWLTLQSYILVTGTSPPGSADQWDCTSPDPRLHWTNDNERYCFVDWQRIIAAIAAVPGVQVTDPLTVGIAFGRPASYPQ